ncbi:hypothetical protein [Paraburkholderia fungorum]|uniref:hypothetical protein n=1 Tax=Paraburkholderia fungorum TaxID=134537 RepID=UPI0016184556|nr:hypothetical protein [Paraburkholderia fungorum]MBB5546633.1 hypothetical protein [Paraburkholderia fungorum]
MTNDELHLLMGAMDAAGFTQAERNNEPPRRAALRLMIGFRGERFCGDTEIEFGCLAPVNDDDGLQKQ